jgi:hypothetical protein
VFRPTIRACVNIPLYRGYFPLPLAATANQEAH